MTSADFQRNAENYCYRHPDRQSFVLCQRCLRTICPECQTQAAVGVICPECMAQQRKEQTPAQRKAERRWARPRAVAGAAGRPVITYGIIAVTALTFLLTLIPGFGEIVQTVLRFWAPTIYPVLPVPFLPWTVLTVALVHSGFWHIGLNMLALWLIGRSLEPLLGRVRFLLLYVLSTVGGSVAVALLSFPTPVVGASGAIFGLFGALLVIGRHIGANVTGIAIILGLNLVLGFLPGFNVSWQAHVGGLVVGALVGLIYARTRTRRRRMWQIVFLVAVALALLATLVLVPPLLYF